MARLVAERQDVIVELAEIFRRYGYDGASLARITQHTKLGKGSLYHFFPRGKEEMGEAVLAHIWDWFETKIFIPLEQDEPARAVANMFLNVEEYFHSGRRICLVGAFALDETRDKFAVRVSGYFDRWLQALSAALQRGGFDPSDARRTARQSVAVIQGGIILARALDDGTQFNAVITPLQQEIAKRLDSNFHAMKAM